MNHLQIKPPSETKLQPDCFLSFEPERAIWISFQPTGIPPKTAKNRIFALTGIGTPALQALATRQVNATRQGQLQGVLASSVSLASIIAPLAFSTFYFVFQTQWPGAIWLSVVVIHTIAVLVVFLVTRTSERPLLPKCCFTGSLHSAIP